MTQTSRPYLKIMSLPNDDPKKTLFIAVLLCLVCSILVAISAVALKPQQMANKQNDIKKNILAVSGLLDDKTNIEQAFKQFEVKIVDLETGRYADIDPMQYDQRQAAKDPNRNVQLSPQQDIANIKTRAKLATVYLLKQDGHIQQVILPIHGYGLWSTLYGFISLTSDLNTIGGLQFYSHAETPGLGGEVDNPKWRAQWHGKKVFDEQGNVRIKVIRGFVNPNSSEAQYHVDGLSGATLTSNGVSNLVQYWLGDHGFGPYLAQLRSDRGQ